MLDVVEGAIMNGEDQDVAFPHAEFAKRLNMACDAADYVPPLNKGQQTWIAAKLEQDFGISTTNESVRRWLAGTSRPRHRTMVALAELLRVDPGWLAASTGELI